MSFPFHDRHWIEAADAIRSSAAHDDLILAPDIFWSLFPKICRYRGAWLHPETRYDWAAIHKGEMHRIPVDVLRRLSAEMTPVFANDVFVVWSRAGGEPASDDHVWPFFAQLAELEVNPPTEDPTPDPVLPDPGTIERVDALDDRSFRESMDNFFRNGGYDYPTRRDSVYFAEIDRHITEMLGDLSGRTVLDLCCGTGRLRQIARAARLVVGADCSRVAVAEARHAHRDEPQFSFVTMDAHNLAFPSRSFDAVVFSDAIEHMRDARVVIHEAARALRPGGVLFLTAANRNSLNQRITRKLGYPEFVTNFQHFAEFTYSEIQHLLDSAGLEITRSTGVFLYPYWGVPGVDEVVREIADEDPEIVEVLRQLGERAGPELAYLSVVLAARTA
jgi:2-polyprenyl-3-methyl-5-hydroxy-6-metoxy-1,4-benzoquinol methylase